jgi:hypothetical protein
LYLSSRDVRREWGEAKYGAVIQREWVIYFCEWDVREGLCHWDYTDLSNTLYLGDLAVKKCIGERSQNSLWLLTLTAHVDCSTSCGDGHPRAWATGFEAEDDGFER